MIEINSENVHGGNPGCHAGTETFSGWENQQKMLQRSDFCIQNIQSSERVSNRVICWQYSNPIKFSGHWAFGSSRNSKQTVQIIICLQFSHQSPSSFLFLEYCKHIIHPLTLLFPWMFVSKSDQWTAFSPEFLSQKTFICLQCGTYLVRWRSWKLSDCRKKPWMWEPP